MSRYSRHIVLNEIGPRGQEKISKARVLVIGAGGLGCPVLQYLTAAGVGTLGIIDFDTVEESNLQRQVLFGTSSLGKNKALAAQERLMDLNNTISINVYPFKLTPSNALELFSEYNIIVDGSDNFPTRYMANDAAILADKPLVYGAIFKFEGQVTVFNYQGGPSYRCLFPSIPKDGSVANCSEIGVLGVLPGIIGSMQANEVLKIILGLGNVLSGHLLLYNALTTQTSTITIPRSNTMIDEVLASQATFHQNKYSFDCESPIPEISIKDISDLNHVQFIDVREPHESPKVFMENLSEIPLNDLLKGIDEISSEKQKIIFCASGVRSKKAVSILKAHKIDECYSLEGGVQAILEFQNNKQYERS